MQRLRSAARGESGGVIGHAPLSAQPRAIAITAICAHIGGMTKRATKRPAEFTKPAHWTDTPPPKPAEGKAVDDPAGLSPTRYGDWVRDGIAVDF